MKHRKESELKFILILKMRLKLSRKIFSRIRSKKRKGKKKLNIEEKKMKHCGNVLNICQSRRLIKY